ncbi:hypothetical protein CY34DRAFT_103067 [Suillus luteus UH-Slu-Lm8-n1]|uniref:Uncharacterized protein n=1 Tax=Suillus luteus UH-Slu-Lm8-n1 TaxID=930992 RepID=A0A0D0AHV8_9AGAM|nr:hypothetical protein CY34DRAFT_103067 [Suillus luteus UH-Slu-Lm8-n1]
MGSCVIKDEPSSSGGLQFVSSCVRFSVFDCTYLFIAHKPEDLDYPLFNQPDEEDHSDLALEAAQAKRRVCQAQKDLADSILEHHIVLTNLHRRRVEAANMRLMTADLDVGRMHIERRRNGIPTFIRCRAGGTN